MRELQGHSKCLQRENDQLRAQIGESRDLGKDVRERDRAVHQITHNKGKEPIVPDDVDTPTDDELSSSNSSLLSLSPTKNTRAKLRKRPSHRPAFSNTLSGASCRARREVGGGQNQSDRVPGNMWALPAGAMPPMSFVHPAFGIGPTFYMPQAASMGPRPTWPVLWNDPISPTVSKLGGYFLDGRV